ncbi:hypothetical protein [Streptomyces syringium]|uniref:hypothetical protein n=1 Tax=Streptomyces syringium TaxID=76729 RepID=UPI00340E8C6C
MSNDPMWQLLAARAQAQLARLQAARDEDRGGLSIEAMILVGSLVAIAAVAAAVLLLKVNEKKDAIK